MLSPHQLEQLLMELARLEWLAAARELARIDALPPSLDLCPQLAAAAQLEYLAARELVSRVGELAVRELRAELLAVLARERAALSERDAASDAGIIFEDAPEGLPADPERGRGRAAVSAGSHQRVTDRTARGRARRAILRAVLDEDDRTGCRHGADHSSGDVPTGTSWIQLSLPGMRP